MILNLLENAADAAATGGADAPTVWIGVTRSNGEVGLTVEDNGRGVPDGVRDRVFDSFVTTKPVGRGTGLGLAICQSLVERLGGRIELGDPVPNRGRPSRCGWRRRRAEGRQTALALPGGRNQRRERRDRREFLVPLDCRYRSRPAHTFSAFSALRFKGLTVGSPQRLQSPGQRSRTASISRSRSRALGVSMFRAA